MYWYSTFGHLEKDFYSYLIYIKQYCAKVMLRQSLHLQFKLLEAKISAQ